MTLSMLDQRIHRGLEMVGSMGHQIEVRSLIGADRCAGPLGDAVGKECGSSHQGLKFVKQELVAIVEPLLP
jgi:hypothetical protein